MQPQATRCKGVPFGGVLQAQKTRKARRQLLTALAAGELQNMPPQVLLLQAATRMVLCPCLLPNLGQKVSKAAMAQSRAFVKTRQCFHTVPNKKGVLA